MHSSKYRFETKGTGRKRKESVSKQLAHSLFRTGIGYGISFSISAAISSLYLFPVSGLIGSIPKSIVTNG